ncbi:MAG: SUF system NifU family Fe-S cluster assembly protein [SAR202 cluster bacterium]|jgi:nitrogen fixation NifU-like protein|nr:SUF system NifU family Fe-S cluster assembly protein [Chloroflexota bacterium]MDP6421335.1 SUF system NifU family Fe-S cluster assembly protein [SAR202 cluster bacterium]HAL48071.1 SUF system NifU family Fe-S cluster assembly protein [Dehalococcoidia bacterium]MDP6665566.1 SUF system NifU family Fe-S cluster assembly protein [SAR202 cluster bacterium]MDP6799207.1 SUF system NifU family Fe-S cluster assembly protein [SAR202 cluster bacterium]|tara:strand:+ start:5233 stop:5682 length:450 start_codon:yes stop_codon:yes gene_type:complete
MARDDLDELFGDDLILDHRRHPRNPEVIDGAAVKADGANPFCGDEVHLQLAIDEQGRVSDTGFQGVGCAINQASGSMLSEAVKGKTIEEIHDLRKLFDGLMQGRPPSEEEAADLGDLAAMTAVLAFPIRIKCALLPWATLEDGIAESRK